MSMLNKKRIVSIIPIAVLVQILFISFWDIEMVKDAKRYNKVALNITKGFGLTEDRVKPTWLYPGVPLVFSGIYRVFGYNPLATKVFQAMLFCFLCVLIYFIGTSCFDEQIGFRSAIVCAFYPPLFILPSILNTEFLFTVGIAALIFSLMMCPIKNSWWIYAFTGMLCAWVSHVRPTGLFVIYPMIIVAFFMFKDKKKYLKFAVVSFIAFAILMTPITLWNYDKHKKPFPMAPVGMAEKAGIRDVPETEAKKNEKFLRKQTERQFEVVEDYYKKAGISIEESGIRKKLKGLTGRIIPQDYTWKPKNILDGVRRLYIGSYSDIYQIGIPLAFFFKDKRLLRAFPREFAWKLVLLLLSTCVFIFALVGFLFGMAKFTNFLPLSMIIFYNTAFYLFYTFAWSTDTTTRYGLPVVPYLIIFAVYGIKRIFSLRGEKNA